MRAPLVLSTLLMVTGCTRSAVPAQLPSGDRATLAPTQWQVQNDPEAPVVELRVAFDGGSADDPPGREGLTYVTVMSMLEGRTGELSFGQRTRLLFPMAAEISVHVEREQIVFSGRVHKDKLAEFYPLFRDVLLKPAFDAVDFERVRSRALSHLTQDLRGADDETLGKEVLQAMLFEGHPYAHPELGSERGLAALTQVDLVRQWSSVLCAARVRLAATGPLDDTFAQRIVADLAALRTSECSTPKALPPASSLNTRRVWIIDKPEAGSVAISIGIPIEVTRAHPDYAALSLAAAYLGQHRTFAGRLMQKMRGARGLNYGDYAYAEHFVQEGETRFPMPNVSRRQQYFSVWVRPVRPEHAHFALRMAIRELEAFTREGLSEADFARMQRFAARYFSLFAQTDQQRLGNDIDDKFYGSVDPRAVASEPHLVALSKRFQTLTREEVNAAVRRHIATSRLQVAMVAKGGNALADKLVRGDASPITYNVEKPADVLAEDKLISTFPLGLTSEQVNVLPLTSIFR